MSENPTIATEIAQLGPGLVSVLVPMSTALRHKVLGFAIENQIPEVPATGQRTAEEVALGIIVTRYFRMVESGRFGQFFNEPR